MSETASQETSNFLKGGKIAGRAPKKPAKLNNLSKIILIQLFSGFRLLKTRPWLNQETKVNVHNRTVLPVSDR